MKNMKNENKNEKIKESELRRDTKLNESKNNSR